MVDLHEHSQRDERPLGIDLLDRLLHQVDAVLLLELLHDGLAEAPLVRRQHAPLGDGAVEDLLDRDAARDADQLRHGRVALGVAVLDERGRARLGLAVGVLDLELVLQHDHVALLAFVLHLLLEGGAQRVERVAARRDGLVREEADPRQPRQDAALLLGRVEGGLGENCRLEVGLAGGLGAHDGLRGLAPAHRLAEDVERSLGQEAGLDEGADELREALVAQGATDDGLSLRDAVLLLEGGGVAVGVGDEGVARVDVVWLGGAHQVLAGDVDDLAVLPVLGVVAQGEQHTARRPAELVAQRVVAGLGSREAAAVGQEGLDLAAGAVDLLDRLDGVQVVDARVEADLVHDGDAGSLGLGGQLLHGGADVAGGHDMLLGADGRLDDLGVEGVRDQGDDEVMLANGGVEGLLVVDIEGDRVGVGDAGGELLGRGEGPAGCERLGMPSMLAGGMLWGRTCDGRRCHMSEGRGEGRG